MNQVRNQHTNLVSLSVLNTILGYSVPDCTVIETFSLFVDPCRGAKQAKLTSGPYQPRAISLRSGQFPRRRIGQRERSFSVNWCGRYHWIEYSPSWDAAFFFYCRLLASHKPGCCESAFINRGYRNWKMASCDFKKHEESKVDRMAASQYVKARSW